MPVTERALAALDQHWAVQAISDDARRQAIDVLLDQQLFVLDEDRYDTFMRALDNPPAPGPKLRSLLRRVPAWRK